MAVVDLAGKLPLIIILVNIIGVVLILHFERRRPRDAAIWLTFIALLAPVGLGIFVYFIFGRAIHRTRRRFRSKEIEDRQKLQEVTQVRKVETPDQTLHSLGVGEYASLCHLLQADQAFLTTGNKVHVINTGEEKFRLMFEDIAAAKEHVNAQYYIIRNDHLGNEFLDLLASKAQEGVEVRLLLDGFGTRFPPSKVKDLRTRGVQTVIFFPPVIPRLPALNLRLNHRNHRKIVVVDGKIGYVGGYNVGDEYLGKKKLGRWRDCHLRVEGPAVHDLQARFLMDWNYASPKGLVELPRFFPPATPAGGAAMQIVSGGPDKPVDAVQQSYVKMIASARQRVWLQTPYFIPDESVLDALRVAALSGVDVKVMVPLKPDHPFVHWANLSFLGELVESGVQGYLYHDGFLHAKTIVVDGAIVSIGSANWDIRSFELNFETNAVIYCPTVAKEQEAAFMEDLQMCLPWTLVDHLSRSPVTKLKCSVSRVFSPLL
jgi:cardiolipin synthase